MAEQEHLAKALQAVLIPVLHHLIRQAGVVVPAVLAEMVLQHLAVTAAPEFLLL
jgi:hypothetical protein